MITHRTKGYTEIEDALIIEYRQKNMSAKAITQRFNELGFNRKKDSITHRIKTLIKSNKIKNLKKDFASFTPDQDEIIIKMREEGYSSRAIAEAISTPETRYTNIQIRNRYKSLARKGIITIEKKQTKKEITYQNAYNDGYNAAKKFFIDKACEWWRKQFDGYDSLAFLNSIIKDFRNTMED